MKFLIDAQLPRRLAERLRALGHEVVHTLELPAGNRTSDSDLCALADLDAATIVSKDADFVISRTLRGSPRRLLVIATGNIGNQELVHLLETNLPAIVTALAEPAHVELNRTLLIVRE